MTVRRTLAWRLAKDGLQSASTAAWSAGFRLAGTVWRSRAAVVSPRGGERVLVIAPHPDDEVCGCGGALLLHKAAGDEVCVAYVTDGRRSRAFGMTPPEMAARRRREAHAASTILGLDRVEWLDLPEGEWMATALEEKLAALLARWQPSLVYAPSRVDFHPEHHRVAHGLSRSLARALAADRVPAVRIFQVQVPLTAVLVNRVMSVTSVAAAHQSALEAHASQRGSILRTVRLKIYGASRHRLAGLAEEFWDVPAGQYRALHDQDPGLWMADRFRGLRYAALTDPLAYLGGRSSRTRLRRVAECA
jgi:LmbE family N-acetylglucosaminyl deacetylase